MCIKKSPSAASIADLTALYGPPRHQSEATIVSDTIHIPGVTVADTKRRKRKPKATEPADDAG